MSIQENGSSIAEYKRIVFLKYCNENGIKKYQLKELSILNKHHKSGLFYGFLYYNIYKLIMKYKLFYIIMKLNFQ